MKNLTHLKFILPSLAVIFLFCACDTKQQPQEKEVTDENGIEKLEELQELASHTKEGVSLKSSLFKSPDGEYYIGYQLKTNEPGFYLYSLTHDSAKADGIGIATSVTLFPNQIVSANGSIIESTASTMEKSETLGIEYSIYPEGSVTLYQPVSLSSKKGEFGVSFSWQACMKSGICKNPVINLSISHNLDLTE